MQREGSDTLESTVLKLGGVLQGGEGEVSDEATETTDLDHAFEKCVSKAERTKTRAASGISCIKQVYSQALGKSQD